VPAAERAFVLQVAEWFQTLALAEKSHANRFSLMLQPAFLLREFLLCSAAHLEPQIPESAQETAIGRLRLDALSRFSHVQVTCKLDIPVRCFYFTVSLDEAGCTGLMSTIRRK
jgi:hypothetical protein